MDAGGRSTAPESARPGPARHRCSRPGLPVVVAARDEVALDEVGQHHRLRGRRRRERQRRLGRFGRRRRLGWRKGRRRWRQGDGQGRSGLARAPGDFPLERVEALAGEAHAVGAGPEVQQAQPALGRGGALAVHGPCHRHRHSFEHGADVVGHGQRERRAGRCGRARPRGLLGCRLGGGSQQPRQQE